MGALQIEKEGLIFSNLTTSHSSGRTSGKLLLTEIMSETNKLKPFLSHPSATCLAISGGMESFDGSVTGLPISPGCSSNWRGAARFLSSSKSSPRPIGSTIQSYACFSCCYHTGLWTRKWRTSNWNWGNLGVNHDIFFSLFQNIQVFAQLESTTDPEDHFEVTSWVFVAISTLNFSWL